MLHCRMRSFSLTHLPFENFEVKIEKRSWIEEEKFIFIAHAISLARQVQATTKTKERF